jgi:hypothetical protein
VWLEFSVAAIDGFPKEKRLCAHQNRCGVKRGAKEFALLAPAATDR